MQKLKASDGAQNSHFSSNGVGISGDYITLSAIGTAIETIYMFKINAAGYSWAEV